AVDSNLVKTDLPALSVITSGNLQATVNTLLDAGTNGGFSDTESITSMTLVGGPTSAAKVDIASGTTIALGNNLTVQARSGLPASGPGALVTAAGNPS